MSWEKVYRWVKKIPRGRVTTYGAVARALGLSGGARAAGYAMAACPSGRGIPWHRVVAAGGRLSIPEPHRSLQRKLLETEGVVLLEGRLDLESHGWPPANKQSKKNIKTSARRPLKAVCPRQGRPVKRVKRH
jgi:methylated-DNA-protein-cysteine methyltransferase related protein